MANNLAKLPGLLLKFASSRRNRRRSQTQLEQWLAIKRSVFVQYFRGRVAAGIGWHYVIKDLSQNPKCCKIPQQHESARVVMSRFPQQRFFPSQSSKDQSLGAHDIYEKEPDH